MNVKISPSILNCDVAHLADELAAVSNADRIHVDVMDNHFVPNLSWGLPIVEAAKGSSELPIDSHLMIADPDRWALGYAEAGSSVVTFHVEAAQAPIRLARELRAIGCKAGLALRPATDVRPYLDLLDEFDLLLVMTVEPGFGGQKFLPQTMAKVKLLRETIDQRQLDLEIQVDGGVNRQTIAVAAAAGADNYVVGSALYGSADPHAEVVALRDIAEANFGS